MTTGAAGPVPGTKLLGGRCSYCRLAVFSTRDAATGQVVVLDQAEVRGRACGRDLAQLLPHQRPPAALEGWDAQGRRLWVNPELAEEPQEVVHRDHARSCWATARAQGKPQPPERGTCKGCGAAMLWVRTVEGKRVPLDPEPVKGQRLVQGERAAGGRIVRGYTLTGAMLAVLVDAPPPQLFDAPPAEEATVYVSHFATCPDREAFTRKPGRSGPPNRGAPRT